MDYKKKRTTLRTLIDLLGMIEGKEKERENAVKFNKKNPLNLEPFDIQKIIDERKELEIEFANLKRSL